LTVLIAAGQPNKKIPVEGIKEFEGRGVSYCTTCDGFFYRGLSVGILGNGAYAVHEATELEAFTKDITIFTNGKDLNVSEDVADVAGRFKINTESISTITGGEFLENIEFTDGRTHKIDGLFVAYGTASSVDFAKKLGIASKDNAIIVDEEQNTNVPGIFASGDCTGGFKQISTAVGQGATAGKSIINYVRQLKGNT
jgi:thioredoxin reductase (NADPH)